MKAEVARREIESLDYYLQNHTDDYGEESHTAMMMAISALSENKGDLISRQAVLDELEKWDWQDLYLPIHFKQILDDVPSVENKGEGKVELLNELRDKVYKAYAYYYNNYRMDVAEVIDEILNIIDKYIEQNGGKDERP